MAWQFHDQIAALTGFDADSGSNVDSGETYQTMTGQWLTDAAKEVINVLPLIMLERCAKLGTAFVPGTGQNVESKVISVIRTRNTEGTPQFDNAGDVFVCRQIPHTLSFKALDPDSLEYATETDPVYYIEPQLADASFLVKVLPVSTVSIAKVNSIDYPIIIYTNVKIDNFPDEAEHLVVLRAAITAAEYQSAIEEDPELYLPIIQTLKQDYMQGLQALGVQVAQPQQQRGR